jgi:hypothetical protein
MVERYHRLRSSMRCVQQSRPSRRDCSRGFPLVAALGDMLSARPFPWFEKPLVLFPFATDAQEQTLYDQVQAHARLWFGSGPEEHETPRPGAWAYAVQRRTVL